MASTLDLWRRATPDIRYRLGVGAFASHLEGAKVLVAQAKSALTQIQELDQEGRYSEMAGVVQSFEDDSVEALTALKSHVKGREGMTLSQVVILVENVREVGRIASRL